MRDEGCLNHTILRHCLDQFLLSSHYARVQRHGGPARAWCRYLALALAWCVLRGVIPRAVQSQSATIKGVVKEDPATHEPSASVILLTDLDGRTIAVVRPTTSGAFAVRPLVPGSYRLRLLRLGYSPLEISVRVGAADVALGILDGPGVPVPLATIRVHGTSACTDARASGRVGDLWRLLEVALATQLADQGISAVGERWLNYEQRVNARSGMVEELQVRDDALGSPRGFHPAPASALADRGFIAPDDAGFTYFLPVATTLLSPEFLQRYCFRAGDGRGPTGDALSLAFRSAREAPGRTDVSGEMVFSPSGKLLEYVRFEYVNPPGVLAGTHAEGKVAFSYQANRTAIGWWWVEMPLVAVGRSQVLLKGVPNSRPEQRAVTTARRRVGALRLSALPCVSCPLGADTAVPGLVLRRDTASDDSTDILTLRLATAIVRSPAEGRAIPWPPGRYEVRTATAWMAAHQVEQTTVLEVADVPRPTMLIFGGLARRDVLTRACAREMPGGGVVGGAVVTQADVPVPGVAIVVSVSGPTGQTNRVTASDERGYWRLCLRSSEIPRRVWVIGDSGGAYAAIEPSDDDPVVDLVVRPPDEPSARVSSPSILEVRVRSQSGQPVEGAEVRLQSAPRTDERRRTDPRGLVVFVVTGVGDLRISAHKVGVSPASVVARVGPGRNAIGLVLFALSPGQLDTVRVLGNRRVSSRLDAFETRARQRQPNTVLRTDQLRQYSRLSDALGRVAGVVVVDSSGQRQARSTRGTRLATSSGRTLPGCRLRVIVDGVPQPAGTSLDDGPSPMQLHGVEVYLASSRFPLEFGGTLGPGECGLLMVWTKDGSATSP